MPPLAATAGEERDLLAFLSRMGGLRAGALADAGESVSRAALDQILHPEPGEWPTYNGDIRGNRHSPLEQINQRNVKNLAPQWVYSMSYFGWRRLRWWPAG